MKAQEGLLKPNSKEKMLQRFKENFKKFRKTFDYLKDK